MKNFLIGVLATALVCLLGFTLFEKFAPKTEKPIEEVVIPDNYPVQQISCMDKVLNCQYTNAGDIMTLHQEVVWEMTNLDVFRDVPTETIQNVANLLLRNKPYVTVPEILEEYLKNKTIYDNMQPGSVLDPSMNASKDSTADSSVKTPEDPKPVAENTASDSTTKANIQKSE